MLLNNVSCDHFETADQTTVRVTLQKLQTYCERHEWAGYEPYDATNSKLFTAIPILDCRLPRLVLTQTLKRSPINVRPLLFIRKTQNPKAIAIFLTGFVKLSKNSVADQEHQIDQMIERLIALRSPGVSAWCWGYSFPWQTRTVLVPRWSPNLVCTVFAAGALLDVYEHRQEPRYLSMARSAGEYILNELYWTDGTSIAGFGYPLPSIRNQIHNANFLAAE